jgi:hypothetical protein
MDMYSTYAWIGKLKCFECVAGVMGLPPDAGLLSKLPAASQPMHWVICEGPSKRKNNSTSLLQRIALEDLSVVLVLNVVVRDHSWYLEFSVDCTAQQALSIARMELADHWPTLASICVILFRNFQAGAL